MKCISNLIIIFSIILTPILFISISIANTEKICNLSGYYWTDIRPSQTKCDIYCQDLGFVSGEVTASGDKSLCAGAQCNYISDFSNCIQSDINNDGNCGCNSEFICTCQSTNEENTSKSCTDSDGGKNYYTKGTLVVKENGATTTIVDVCSADGITLHEWYCGVDNSEEVQQYTCPNGCKDGACIQVSNPCDLESTSLDTKPECEAAGCDWLTNTNGCGSNINSCGFTPHSYDCSIKGYPHSTKWDGVVSECIYCDCNWCCCPSFGEFYCGDGTCNQNETCSSCPQDCGECPSGNRKDSNSYNNPIFIISDKNWEDVLSLIPVTTWTSKNDSKWCRKGYETADNVCVYPTLIFYEEESSLMLILLYTLYNNILLKILFIHQMNQQ
jgi:hypothetical protein